MVLYNGDLPPLGAVTTANRLELLDRLLRLLRTTGDLSNFLGLLLERAVADGDVDLVRKMLAGGASPNAQCSDGDSILHLAAGTGSWEAVRVLIIFGAEVNATGGGGCTALHTAASRDQVATIQELLQTGADKGVDINAQDEEGRTPLHAATMKDNAASVRVLHARGADVGRLDSSGCTPLHWGVARELYGHGPYALDALLDAGVDVNVRQADVNAEFSPLDQATAEGNLEVLQKLLEHGANVNDANATGHTALHMATCLDLDGAINLLVGAGANVNAEAEHGTVPLHCAAANLLMGPARALLVNGASVNARNAWGRSPLHLAAASDMFESGNRADMVDCLMQSGADEEAVDGDGHTPEEVLGYLARPLTRVDARALHLLVNASKDRADRAWDRRQFLVVYRASLLRPQTELPDRAGGASRQAPGVETRNGKRARLQAAESARVADEARAVLENVAGVGDESVFRNVAMFL